MATEDPGFDETLKSQINAAQRDVAELRQQLLDTREGLVGRPEQGWLGLYERIRNAETNITRIDGVQSSFIKDQERKQKINNRIQVAVLAALSTVVAGVVLQLFLVAAGASGP